jgi:flagellar motility protein MotE (MotC chaperone)
MFPELPAEEGHEPLDPAHVGTAEPGHAAGPELPDAPKPDADQAAAAPHETAAHAPAAAKPAEAHAGIFDLIDVDGLYTQDELRALGDSLRAKNREALQRSAEIDRREELLADRLTALDERRRTLDEFAKQLDAREREVAAREAESKSSGGADGSGTGSASPADLAEFFADGEVEVLTKRLSGFTPEEAAKILVRLEPARAKELLEALPTASWRAFAEAYALAAPKKP